MSRPEDIGYDQFRTGPKGEVLFWTPGDGHKIRMTTTKGGFRFRALSVLANVYGRDGTDALRRLLGFGPKSKIPWLSKATEQTIRKEIEASPSPESIGNAERDKLPGFADNKRRSTERIMTILHDHPEDAAWFYQAVQEFAGLKEVMMTTRDALVYDLARFQGLEEDITNRAAPRPGASKTLRRPPAT